jgi:hypothetical protein
VILSVYTLPSEPFGFNPIHDQSFHIHRCAITLTKNGFHLCVVQLLHKMEVFSCNAARLHKIL